MSDKPLKVTSASCEPSFDSFSEAVSAAGATARAARARSDWARVNGKTLLGYRSFLDRVEFLLSDGIDLVVTAGDTAVEWEVHEKRSSESHEDGSSTRERLCELPSVSLDYEGIPEPAQWNRQALLDSRMGRKISVLSASFAWLFLSVDGCEELMFSVMAELDSERRLLLYWPP